jgi:hypothetical protein
VHKEIISAVQRVEFVSDRTSYSYNKLLRDRWCDIIILNVRAPTEDKCDDSNNSCYEELERLFDHLSKNHY